MTRAKPQRKPVDRTVFPRPVPHDRRFPFNVCLVGLTSYVYLETVDIYSDACIVADIAKAQFGCHTIVWDTLNERVLYDSRRVSR